MSDATYTNQERSEAKQRLKVYLKGLNGDQVCLEHADFAAIQGKAELGAGQSQTGPSVA